MVLTLASGQPEIPKIEAPALGDRPVNSTEHSELFEQVVGMETPTLDVQTLTQGQDYEVRETKAGRLYSVVNPYSDLSAIQFRYENGSFRDPLLCLAAQLWRRAGVGDLDQSGWDDWLYQRAVSVNIGCGEESVSLTLSGPAEQLIEVLPMVRQKLAEPVMNPKLVEAYLNDYVARRQDNKISADVQQNALRKCTLYGDKSPLLQVASDEQILGTSLEEYAETCVYAGCSADDDVRRPLGY